MNPVIKSRNHKWCPCCKISKRLTYFSKNHRNRLGVDAYCKQCSGKKAKRFFSNRLKRRQMIKTKLILEFGNKCSDCGFFDLPIAAFTFHHHSEKMGDRSYLPPSKVITYQQADVILKEKKKWILLCSNCHNVKHSNCKLSATKFVL
jgi:hypothetical protein